MKKIQYLSPSSMSCYRQDKKEFYYRYLCENRPPAPPQTMPMSAGSAFDAYAKSYLHEKLFGKGNDPKFDLTTLFESQVESKNRDWAWKMGAYLFTVYQKSGALADLMLELSGSISEPKFEIEVRGIVNGYKEGVTRDVSGVVLLGKPDVFWVNKHACSVVLDFKVNGACANYNVSPMKGYLRLRDIGNSSGGGKAHKACLPMMHKGIMVNVAEYMENLDATWAAQLAVYGWLLGLNVGEDFVCAIDQICCDGTTRFPFDSPLGRIDVPLVRVAEHRLRISEKYQYEVFAAAQ